MIKNHNRRKFIAYKEKLEFPQKPGKENTRILYSDDLEEYLSDGDEFVQYPVMVIYKPICSRRTPQHTYTTGDKIYQNYEDPLRKRLRWESKPVAQAVPYNLEESIAETYQQAQNNSEDGWTEVKPKVRDIKPKQMKPEDQSDKQAYICRNVKTRLCKNGEKCPYGDKCTFAHNQEQLYTPECKFGTKCVKKAECRFRHPEETKQEYYKRINP